LHFFSFSSEFSVHWEKTFDCFVFSRLISLFLSLSLSLSFTPATHTFARERGEERALAKGRKSPRFLRETEEFVFESSGVALSRFCGN
jgi:hypothetical protein